MPRKIAMLIKTSLRFISALDFITIKAQCGESTKTDVRLKLNAYYSNFVKIFFFRNCMLS